MFEKLRKHEKKQAFMVRVSHAIGFVNLKPTTLELAREQAEKIHQLCVREWAEHGSGNRPITEIWEMVETVAKHVEGVDHEQQN